MNGHIFTEAGLGKSPFKVIGYEERSTGCALCGRGIKKVSIVRSSDGIVSSIGCECVKKSGDKGLIEGEKLAIKRHKAKIKYEAQMSAYYEIMLEKWGNHPHIDQQAKENKEAYLREMERVCIETANGEI